MKIFARAVRALGNRELPPSKAEILLMIAIIAFAVLALAY